MKKKVLVILIGNIRYDGRVQKTIKTLLENKFDVKLICSEFDSDDSIDNYDYDISYIKRKSGGGILLQLFRNLSFYMKIQKKIKDYNPVYIHCNDLSSTIYILKDIKKYKVIYDSHELALELLSGVRLFLFSALEKYIVKYSYKIILPQIDRLNVFFFRYNRIINKSKLYLVENFPLKHLDINNKFFESYYGISQFGKKIISYTGAITQERNIEQVIRSIIDIDEYYLIIIGRGSKSYLSYLKTLVVDLNLESRVYIMPPLENKYMLDVAASSQIGVCFYTDYNLNSYFCASNKIYEFINSDVKVLTNNIGGTSRVINSGINGILLDEILPKSIKEGIIKLDKINLINNIKYYWENQEDVLLNIYD